MIILERDWESKKRGYSSKSYVKTLEQGLLSYYKPEDMFQQDNAPMHNSNLVKEWLETRDSRDRMARLLTRFKPH